MKILWGTASKACPALAKKKTKATQLFVPFFFFSLSFFSQQAEDNINQNQTLQHPGQLAHGKLPYATPH
jgi:hypothetical protein